MYKVQVQINKKVIHGTGNIVVQVPNINYVFNVFYLSY